jgi:hypothetical protein
MKTKRLTQIILVLSVIALLASIGCAKRSVQAQGVAAPAIEGTKTTVKGKIDYMENLGGYFFRGEDPYEVYFIVNQDPKLLKELMKSRKTVIIDGHYTIGADHLFIEKIDGQPYAVK